MDSKEFREAAVSSIDDSKCKDASVFLCWLVDSSSLHRVNLRTDFAKLVVHYYDTIEERPVVSTVEPGYLRKLLPDHAPEDGEAWSDIQKDVQTKIVPGLTHW